MNYAIATPNTNCGMLMIFTHDALKEVLDKVATAPQIQTVEEMVEIDQQKDDKTLVDGYSAEEWAKYAVRA